MTSPLHPLSMQTSQQQFPYLVYDFSTLSPTHVNFTTTISLPCLWFLHSISYPCKLHNNDFLILSMISPLHLLPCKLHDNNFLTLFMISPLYLLPSKLHDNNFLTLSMISPLHLLPMQTSQQRFPYLVYDFSTPSPTLQTSRQQFPYLVYDFSTLSPTHVNFTTTISLPCLWFLHSISYPYKLHNNNFLTLSMISPLHLLLMQTSQQQFPYLVYDFSAPSPTHASFTTTISLPCLWFLHSISYPCKLHDNDFLTMSIIYPLHLLLM